MSDQISSKQRFFNLALAKGWTVDDLADRWGVSERQIRNIANKPSQRHWDMLNGLPIVIKGDPDATT